MQCHAVPHATFRWSSRSSRPPQEPLKGSVRGTSWGECWGSGASSGKPLRNGGEAACCATTA
eukprot:381399-Alexandrium_andersonii.AAC.1